MDVQELLGQARDVITVRRVFGDPVERDGVTVIPVARVMGGAGFGSGMEPAGAAAEGGAAMPGGSGAGFGAMAGPSGVYVIRGDEVTWQPAVNPERIVLIAGVVSFFILLGVRGVVKALRGR